MELADSPVSAAQLGGLLKRIADDTISGKIAKQVFEAMWDGEGDADTVIEKHGSQTDHRHRRHRSRSSTR